jgi:hypothetical protein
MRKSINKPAIDIGRQSKHDMLKYMRWKLGIWGGVGE